jgi:alcohol dehydrogenase class IV
MRYEFATASRIVVGPGSAAELPGLAAGLGGRALLALGQGAAARGGPVAQLAEKLATRGLVAASFTVVGEPRVTDVDEGARVAREAGCDMVIGLGGGSVLDTAKAIAALAANSGGALAYMEVVGAGRPL